MTEQTSQDATPRRLQILILCDKPPAIAATLHHHLDALVRYSKHQVRLLPMFGFLPRGVDLDRFDVVVIHWSLIACSDNYIDPDARARISACKALKAVFIQDEYRFIHRTWEALRGLGVNVLFTCVPDEEIEKVYPSEALPNLVKVNVMTGYVDESLPTMTVPPYAERPIDVGYRARKLPYWMGKLAVEKWRISERFAEDAPRYGLKADVSYREEDRIYGANWNKFITSCKAMLGVESGVSVFDFDGTLQTRLEAVELANPEMTFDEMYERHLKDFDGLIRLNQISPRCFEAAALRTLMILYEGDYSGCLTPWRHFVPLKKDHSNMDEVVAVLRDPARAQEIIDTAYREVALNPAFSFAAAVAQFDRVIDENMKPVHAGAAPYDEAAFESARRALGAATRLRLFKRRTLNGLHRLVYGVLLKNASDANRKRVQRVLRAILRGLKAVIKAGR